MHALGKLEFIGLSDFHVVKRNRIIFYSLGMCMGSI